jgi:hypothetical protein
MTLGRPPFLRRFTVAQDDYLFALTVRNKPFPARRIARLSIEGVGSCFLVLRKSLQIVVLVCLVAFAFAYPVIESLDHWDAANPACDSELEAIVALTFAGAIFL